MGVSNPLDDLGELVLAFKTDASFLEKIAIGAIGARKVFHNLSLQGHKPVELERGSLDYKIWKEIKIKRIRVPDMFCLNCGRRVESRAKTKLEISMSHSLQNVERGWDSGLDNGDKIAFVHCSRSGDRPIDWTASNLVQYVSVEDCRKAFKKNSVVRETPKGATEGFEQRITWPTAISKVEGKVIQVNGGKIIIAPNDGTRGSLLKLEKRGLSLKPLVKVGQEVKEGQILAGVVPVTETFDCEGGGEERFHEYLDGSLSEKYTACKALGRLYHDKIKGRLIKILESTSNHQYVRLEAAAALMKNRQPEGFSYFQEVLEDEYLESKLEAIIILSELKNEESFQLTSKVLLSRSEHPEIRAGAAWALGNLADSRAIDLLIGCFNVVELRIREEAAKALAALCKAFDAEISQKMHGLTGDKLAGVSWALTNSGAAQVDRLLPLLGADEVRRWIAWILGNQDKTKVIGEIEKVRQKDPEVYFAVTVLWQVVASWTSKLEEY